MTTKYLEKHQVNPNARMLKPDEHEVCKYCGRKARWYLKFKTTDAYCCQEYHGDCPVIKGRAIAARKKYGEDYDKWQQMKRQNWQKRTKDSSVNDIPDGLMKI
jgi:hypothetical protein